MRRAVLSSARVDRYRGLVAVELPELARVNLLVGANNAGKTSVLEALYLSTDPVNPERWIAVAQGRELAPAGELLFQSLQGLFPRRASGSESEIDLQYHGREIPPGRHIYAQSSRRIEVAGGKAGQEEVLVVTVGIEPVVLAPAHHPARQSGAFRVPSRTPTSIEPTTTREAIPCVFLSPVAHRGEAAQIGALSAILGNREAKRGLLGLLSDFDKGVQDVFVSASTPAQSEIRILHAETGDAAISSFGDGFRRVLTYALALHKCRGGLLLIDEIETAIHFSALKRVYSWLAKAALKQDVQVVATTHSLEALDAILSSVAPGAPRKATPDNEFEPTEIPPAGAENLAVYRLTRDGMAQTVQRLSGPEAWDLRYRGGLELR
jgi:hypothetical protein